MKIIFSNVLYNTPIQPNYVSHLDCFHPNRAGQMKMAEVLWQAFDRTSAGVYAVWYDAFENSDSCTQELGLPLGLMLVRLWRRRFRHQESTTRDG